MNSSHFRHAGFDEADDFSAQDSYDQREKNTIEGILKSCLRMLPPEQVFRTVFSALAACDQDFAIQREAIAVAEKLHKMNYIKMSELQAKYASTGEFDEATILSIMNPFDDSAVKDLLGEVGMTPVDGTPRGVDSDSMDEAFNQMMALLNNRGLQASHQARGFD